VLACAGAGRNRPLPFCDVKSLVLPRCGQGVPRESIKKDLLSRASVLLLITGPASRAGIAAQRDPRAAPVGQVAQAQPGSAAPNCHAGFACPRPEQSAPRLPAEPHQSQPRSVSSLTLLQALPRSARLLVFFPVHRRGGNPVCRAKSALFDGVADHLADGTASGFKSGTLGVPV